MQSILVLTPQVPYPPQQGTALRNWGILRALAEHYNVSLMAFYAADQNPEAPAILRDALDRVALFPQPQRQSLDRLRDLLFKSRPDLVQRLQSTQFTAALQDWLAHDHFDWIIVEGLEMAPYLDLVKACPHPPRVLFDDHNCEYILQQRAAKTDWHKPKRWIGAHLFLITMA